MTKTICLSNERQGILDLSAVQDVIGVSVVLKPKGQKDSTRECFDDVLEHPAVQKMLEIGWVTSSGVDLVPVVAAASAPAAVPSPAVVEAPPAVPSPAVVEAPPAVPSPAVVEAPAPVVEEAAPVVEEAVPVVKDVAAEEVVVEEVAAAEETQVSVGYGKRNKRNHNG